MKSGNIGGEERWTEIEKFRRLRKLRGLGFQPFDFEVKEIYIS